MLRKTFGTKAYAPLRKRLIKAGILDPQKEALKLSQFANKFMKEKKIHFADTSRLGHAVRQSLRGKQKIRPKQRFPMLAATVAKKVPGTTRRTRSGRIAITAPSKDGPAKAHEVYEALALQHGSKWKGKNLLGAWKSLSSSDRRMLGGFRRAKAAGQKPYTTMPSLRLSARAQSGDARPPQFFSHESPSVVLRESQTVPFLPKSEQKKLLALRTGREAAAFRRAGLRFGSTPKIRKKDIKKLRQVHDKGQ